MDVRSLLFVLRRIAAVAIGAADLDEAVGVHGRGVHRAVAVHAAGVGLAALLERLIDGRSGRVPGVVVVARGQQEEEDQAAHQYVSRS